MEPSPRFQRPGCLAVLDLCAVVDQALAGRLGLFLVTPYLPVSFASRFDLLEGCRDAVSPHSPGFQQVANQRDNWLIAKPIVAEQLSHMSVVLL